MHSSRRAMLRTLLGAGLLGSTAGCIGFDHTADLWIENDSGATRTVTVRAVRLDTDEVLLADSFELEDGADTEYAEFAGEFNCEVSIEVEGGPSNRTVWRDSGSDSYTLSASIGPAGIAFRETAV